MTAPSPGPGARRRRALPLPIAIAVLVALTLVFVALLFPWRSLADRMTYELARSSGGRIEIGEIGPAWSARGPVLRARNVLMIHPAFDRVDVTTLEIAPRLSRSWLRGEPTLRVWADSELGLVDGIVSLGTDPAFVGHVSRVDLARIPLRLESSGVQLSGELEADADVGLDPSGVLSGRVDFTSPSLVVQSDQLPIALPFTRATGVIELLEDGATRVQSVVLEGEVVEGEIDGEVGLVHHSASPPIDVRARLRIRAPLLRQMAPSAGLPVSRDGETSVRVRGTLEEPRIEPLDG